MDTTTTAVGFSSMGADMEKAKEEATPAAAHQLPISKDDKTTILLNVETAVKELVSSLAKRGEIKGADIDVEKLNHLPTSLTGVMLHYFLKGIKEDFDIAFEQAPVSLKIRSTNPLDAKVAGKKRLLTREQKNELLAKTQMSYYELNISKGDMTIEQAMYAIKDAFERKQNFEEMGYILPPKKTEYPYWAEDVSNNEVAN